MIFASVVYATAQTTIPQKVAVKGFESGNENDVYGIKALVDDNPDEKNYYKFFIKVLERDSMYLSSNFAVIDDKDYTFPCTIPVTIGRSRIFDTYDSHIMTEKDCVMVKFAQIDSFAYYNVTSFYLLKYIFDYTYASKQSNSSDN